MACSCSREMPSVLSVCTVLLSTFCLSRACFPIQEPHLIPLPGLPHTHTQKIIEEERDNGTQTHLVTRSRLSARPFLFSNSREMSPSVGNLTVRVPYLPQTTCEYEQKDTNQSLRAMQTQYTHTKTRSQYYNIW